MRDVYPREDRPVPCPIISFLYSERGTRPPDIYIYIYIFLLTRIIESIFDSSSRVNPVASERASGVSNEDTIVVDGGKIVSSLKNRSGCPPACPQTPDFDTWSTMKRRCYARLTRFNVDPFFPFSLSFLFFPRSRRTRAENDYEKKVIQR